MAKIKKAELEKRREQSIKILRKLLPVGTTVYTVLNSVSSSGMSRHITVIIARHGNKNSKRKPFIQNISAYVSDICGYKWNGDGSLTVGGCGMDMGFSVVYNLSSALYPEGFKLPKGQYGRNGDKSGFDKSGGYALKQSWL